MTKENEIKKELLRQMEEDSTQALYTDDNSAHKVLQKHSGQLKRLQRIAIAIWIITALYALAAHYLQEYLLKNNFMAFLKSDEYWFVSHLDAGLMVLIVASVFILYLVYIKSKTLTMLQISARLANIEEYLKKISQEK